MLKFALKIKKKAMTNKQLIESVLTEALPEAQIHILDPMEDDTHLEAIVISQTFEGKSLIAQHKACLAPLKEKFNNQSIHALGLKTYTLKQWQAQQAQCQ